VTNPKRRSPCCHMPLMTKPDRTRKLGCLLRSLKAPVPAVTLQRQLRHPGSSGNFRGMPCPQRSEPAIASSRRRRAKRRPGGLPPAFFDNAFALLLQLNVPSIVSLPSLFSSSPWIKGASWERRKTMTAGISSGSASRTRGVSPMRAFHLGFRCRLIGSPQGQGTDSEDLRDSPSASCNGTAAVAKSARVWIS
jgi:hypothetical protein